MVGTALIRRVAGFFEALGDEARLRQVVTNLVGNAVAHTRPARRHPDTTAGVLTRPPAS